MSHSRKPLESHLVFMERRARLAAMIPGSALIVTSPTEKVRNGSVHFPFRQDSNLYFLTGFEEPQATLIFRPGQTPETVMFVRKKDLEKETWDGFRFGPEQVKAQFRIDEVYLVEDFHEQAVRLLKGCESLYYRMYKNSEMDIKVQAALLDLKARQGRTGYGILSVHDADELIGELRVKKSAHDIEQLRKACEISAEAHHDLMHYIKPGMNEREAHGYFIYQAMRRGASREGYNGIVAGGANATTLHYVFNDEILQDNELVLIDCGAEHNYFTGDITRTYPVGKKFTSAQKDVYQGVLNVQKTLIEMVKPGVPFQLLHETGASMLTDLMLELGLLTGRKEDIMKANEHRKYYPHGIGHFLGMDVHDAGLYFDKKGTPRKIEENMTFTIEPGLYIPANDESANKELRGIGVRIEDNIRVTQTGYENMTVKALKEISDIEAIKSR